MSETQTLKIMMNKLCIDGNGDSNRKSDFSWNLQADGETIHHGNCKVGDGETILIGESATVTKGEKATLTVHGTVSDKDSFPNGGNDTRSFTHTWTHNDKFGLGSHAVRLTDGKRLDVTVHYSVAKA